MALPRIAVPGAPWALLLLLLCAREATQALGFGILPLHDFDCSQPGVECTAKEVDVPPISWFEGITWNPMPPQQMNVRPALLTDPSCPYPQAVLNITWKVATDASILHLEGAEVCVLRYQGSHSMCVRYAFSPFTSSHSPSGRPWEFYFDRFEAEPSMHYLVYIYSLPMAMAGQDDLHILAKVDMPDCRNEEMMLTRNCVITGSLWQPRVQTSFCDNELVVNFTTSDIYSEKYHVIIQLEQGHGNRQRLEQCINSTKEDRKSVISEFDEGLLECSILSVETKEHRKSVIFHIDQGLQDCCNFSVEIIPFFEACKNDCTRKLMNVTRLYSEKTTGFTHKLKCDGPAHAKIIVLAGVAVFLLSLLFFAIIFLRMRRRRCIVPKKHTSPLRIPGKSVEKPTVAKRRKVLLLYSMDHTLYEEVICCLAMYLQNHCGFEVILDQYERQHISLTGHMNWLQARKTEMEMDPGNKIMIVCSKGVMVKWWRFIGLEGQTSRRYDYGIIGDTFTPALSLIMNDFKDPIAARNKYIVTYFEDFDSKDNVPNVLRMALQYGLMTNMRNLWFRIHGMELHGPGVKRHVSGISVDDYHTTVTGKHLYEAINKFKMFQKSNPTWFEHVGETTTESVVSLTDGVERDSVVQHCLQVNLPDCYQSKINPAMPLHIVQTHLLNPSSPNNGVIHSHITAPPALAQSDIISRPLLDEWPADRVHRNIYLDWKHHHTVASNHKSSVEASPRSEGYHSSSSENGRCSTLLTTNASHDGQMLESANSRNGLREFTENATLLDYAGHKVGWSSVDNNDSGIVDGLSGDVESSDVSDSMLQFLHEFQWKTLSEQLNDQQRSGTTNAFSENLGLAMSDILTSETTL